RQVGAAVLPVPSPPQATSACDVTSEKQLIPGVQVQLVDGQSGPTGPSPELMSAGNDVNSDGQKLACATVMPSVKPALTGGTHCVVLVQSESSQSVWPSQSLSTPSKQAAPLSATGTHTMSGGTYKSAGSSRSAPTPRSAPMTVALTLSGVTSQA